MSSEVHRGSPWATAGHEHEDLQRKIAGDLRNANNMGTQAFERQAKCDETRRSRVLYR